MTLIQTSVFCKDALRNPKRYFAGSNPPMTRGLLCDSAHIRPVVATPETPTTGATSNPPGFSSDYKGRPLHACPEEGIGPNLGVSHFPVVKAAACARA